MMTHLKEGDLAPDFTAPDQTGAVISLSAYRGKKVLLYFYPKDSTPGCTMQACNLRDNMELLRSNGYVVIGVSADSEKSHQKFIDKYKLPFTLIADTDKKICMDYGVYGEKKFMGINYIGIARTSFVISEQGLIEKIIVKVKTKDHTSQILS